MKISDIKSSENIKDKECRQTTLTFIENNEEKEIILEGNGAIKIAIEA